MSREKIKLGKAEALPSGKVRWKKMFKRRLWKSCAYDGDSRRNRSAAWTEFLEWRKGVIAEGQEELDPLASAIAGVFDKIEKYHRILGANDEAVTIAKAKANLQLLSHEKLDSLVESLTEGQVVADMMKTVDLFEENNPSSQEATIGDLGKRFILSYRQRAEGDQITTGRYGMVRSGVNRFVTWFGEASPSSSVSERTVSDYHSYLVKLIAGGDNQNTIADAFSTFKLFIETMAEESEGLSLPRNLRSKLYSIPRVDVEPNPLTVDEVELFLENASDRSTLYILLMLNCGMYPSDIADIRPAELDWTKGRLIRARSKKRKLKKHAKAKDLRVNWILWDRTWELLQKLGNADGELLLTNSAGRALVRGGVKDSGVEWRIDNVKSAYSRLVTKLKNRKKLSDDWHKTPKQLRKVGANLLEGSPHAEFVEAFLDHSTVARRAYLAGGKPNPRFDEAIIWLGNELNLTTSDR